MVALEKSAGSDWDFYESAYVSWILILAASVMLGWDKSPEATVSKYKLYVGIQSMVAGNPALVSYEIANSSAAPTYKVDGLDLGTQYFFVVTAVDGQGLEFGYSNEVAYTAMPSLTPTPTLMLLANADAATRYCRAGATGANNGTDWTNAYTTIAALETHLIRGETGYVADGDYTNATCNTPVSGTTVITIKKATEADHGTDTGWSSTYGDGQAVFTGSVKFDSSYWVFDGITGGGPGSWKTGFGFRINSPKGWGPAVWVNNGTNINVRHVEMHGNGGGDDTGPDNDGLSVYPGCHNVTLSYAYIVDVGRCPMIITANNALVEYVYTSTFESTGADHSEVLSAWYGLDGTGNPGISNLTVRWSVFTYFEGTGGLLTKGNGVYIYGNVFYRTNSNTMPHGFHGKWDQKPIHNLFAYNNTYIDPYPISPFFRYGPVSGEGSISNVNIRNGILYLDAAWDSGNFSNVTHNYNHFAGITGTTVAGEANGSSSSSNPFVNYPAENFGLTAAAAAGMPAGETLGPPYNVDMFGNTRGADGKWDRGAIEYVESGPDVTPPLVFSAQINPAGNQLIVSFSEAIEVGGGGFGGMTISSSTAVAATLSNGTVTGTSEITYDVSRTINSNETITRSYTQPGDGIQDTSPADNDLASFSAQSVTNNSTQGQVTTPTTSKPPSTVIAAPSTVTIWPTSTVPGGCGQRAG